MRTKELPAMAYIFILDNKSNEINREVKRSDEV